MISIWGSLQNVSQSFSSEKSPQSLSPLHHNDLEMHCPCSHFFISRVHSSGAVSMKLHSINMYANGMKCSMNNGFSFHLRQFSSSFSQSGSWSQTQAFGMHWLFEHLNSFPLHVLLFDFPQLLNSSSSASEQSWFWNRINVSWSEFESEEIYCGVFQLTFNPSQRLLASMHFPSEHKYWCSWHSVLLS